MGRGEKGERADVRFSKKKERGKRDKISQFGCMVSRWQLGEVPLVAAVGWKGIAGTRPAMLIQQ